MISRALIFFLAVLSSPAFAQNPRGVSAPDPFVIFDAPGFEAYRDTNGKSVRSQEYDPSKKTLILISAGQSHQENTIPTLYIPSNSAAVDNFSIYDGASYSITGPLLGTSSSPLGPGNYNARLADLFINNGRFDRVILVTVGIGSTVVADWAVGHTQDRLPVAMRRLASRGFVPGNSGLTFAITWLLGPTDGVNGTTQAQYMASFQQVVANVQAAGFVGSSCRIFVNLETWQFGTLFPTIRAAQAGVVNNSVVFAGADDDTLGSPLRQADNEHFNDAGAQQLAQIIFNAMHASGGPY